MPRVLPQQIGPFGFIFESLKAMTAPCGLPVPASDVKPWLKISSLNTLIGNHSTGRNDLTSFGTYYDAVMWGP